MSRCKERQVNMATSAETSYVMDLSNICCYFCCKELDAQFHLSELTSWGSLKDSFWDLETKQLRNINGCQCAMDWFLTPSISTLLQTADFNSVMHKTAAAIPDVNVLLTPASTLFLTIPLKKADSRNSLKHISCNSEHDCYINCRFNTVHYDFWNLLTTTDTNTFWCDFLMCVRRSLLLQHRPLLLLYLERTQITRIHQTADAVISTAKKILRSNPMLQLYRYLLPSRQTCVITKNCAKAVRFKSIKQQPLTWKFVWESLMMQLTVTLDYICAITQQGKIAMLISALKYEVVLTFQTAFLRQHSFPMEWLCNFRFGHPTLE